MTAKKRTPAIAWLGRAALLGGVTLLGYVWVREREFLDRNTLDADPRGSHLAGAPSTGPVAPTDDAPTPETPIAKPNHRSPAHAARAGDHEALLDYIADGVDINEINPANLVGTISKGQVQTLRVLFEHGYEHHMYAGNSIGDLGIKYNQPEVVKLVQEFGGPIGAPPEYVALVLGDPVALAATLAERERARDFIGRDLDWWAKELGQENVLGRARRQ